MLDMVSPKIASVKLELASGASPTPTPGTGFSQLLADQGLPTPPAARPVGSYPETDEPKPDAPLHDQSKSQEPLNEVALLPELAPTTSVILPLDAVLFVAPETNPVAPAAHTDLTRAAPSARPGAARASYATARPVGPGPIERPERPAIIFPTVQSCDLTAVIIPQCAGEPSTQTAPILALGAKAAPLDAIVARHLDLGRSDRWLVELAGEISDIQSDHASLNFKLKPAHLGPLQVSFIREEGKLSVELNTRTESAQAALTAAAPKLEQELRSRGHANVEAQVFRSQTESGSGRDHRQPTRAQLIEAEISPRPVADDRVRSRPSRPDAGLFA